MQTKRQIQELLSAAGVSPNRRLGQHFLVDLNLLRLLVDSADPGPGDVVLEVGCGTGSLTEALAERAGAVVAVEIDPTLASIAKLRLTAPPDNPAEGPARSDAARRFRDTGVPPMSSTGIPSASSEQALPVDASGIHGRDAHATGAPKRERMCFGNPPHGQDARATECGTGGFENRPYATNNVQIVNADVLSGKGTLNPAVVEAVERARAAIAETSVGRIGPMGPVQEVPEGGSPEEAGRLLLVSNLPYDVASPVVIDLAKGPPAADAMFVTVQREVAERMTARPGGREYGTLSIFLQATGQVEVLRVLKPSVFWPPPAVDSAMVHYVRDKAKSRRIEDMATLSGVVALFMGHRRKMLRACLKNIAPQLGDHDLWMGLLERLGIDPTLRPGDLTPDQYVALANAWRDA